MKRTNRYSVYALVKNGECVYIGCSMNPQQRKFQHKKDKDFDKLVVIKSRLERKNAYNIENGIIEFLTLFGNGNWYNAEKILTQCRRFYLREESRDVK